MRTPEDTPRDRDHRYGVTMIDRPALPGFVPDPITLPAPRSDVAHDRRERAALVLMAVAYGHTPEDIARGIAPEIVEAFGDELERDEALAHVDLLLDALTL
ncbi:MAG: hypothetical protein ACLGI5_20745 [Thermoleophilia bacterium]